MPASSWTLVGRDAELEQIAAARSQGHDAIVVHGPAGVGKSRLTREALAAAERAGAVTDWVQATRSAAAVPLGAFATVIPSETRSDDLFELLQRGVGALRDRAGGRPLVLGVDDAQWLDPTSATLVLHLASTATAFVIATVRADEPCPDAIVSLWKDGGAPRLELGLLTGPEAEFGGLLAAGALEAGGGVEASLLLARPYARPGPPMPTAILRARSGCSSMPPQSWRPAPSTRPG